MRSISEEITREWKKEYRCFVRHAKWFPDKETVQAASSVVIHFVPLRCVLPEKSHLGSSKDISGRWEYFEQRKVRAVTFPGVINEGRPLARKFIRYSAARFLREHGLIEKEVTAIIDAPGSFPKLALILKRLCPKIRIVYRAHNAEFPHRWERLRVTGGSREKKRLWKIVLQQILSDARMLRRSDVVLSISDADRELYWKRLSRWVRGSSQILTLPYFLSAPYVPCLEKSERQKLAVCISSGQSKESIIDESVVIFKEAVLRYRRAFPDSNWKFCITGGVADVDASTGIEVTGFVNSPLDVLVKSRVACVFTNHGWGFKTKILDAILAETMVLVSQTVYRRLPIEVRPYCLAVDPLQPQALHEALEIAEVKQAELETPTVNETFRDRSFAVLDGYFS